MAHDRQAFRSRELPLFHASTHPRIDATQSLSSKVNAMQPEWAEWEYELSGALKQAAEQRDGSSS